MSKIRWEPSRTSREEVFSAMILFLELLAREEKTQVVRWSLLYNWRPAGNIVTYLSSKLSIGVRDRSTGGHVRPCLDPLEATELGLH